MAKKKVSEMTTKRKASEKSYNDILIEQSFTYDKEVNARYIEGIHYHYFPSNTRARPK
jgi:hypothetical protein